MRLGHWPKWKSWQLLVLAAGVAILAWEAALLAGYQPQECEEGSKACHALQEPVSALLYPLFWAFRWIDQNDTIVVALSGLAVAAFTFTLWLSTRALWKAGERQWRVSLRATRAAELSARAAVRIELPVVRPRNHPDRYELRGGEPFQDETGQVIANSFGGERYRIPSVEFWNAGRTVAIISKIQLGWSVEKNLPSKPNYVLSAIPPGGIPLRADGGHRDIIMPTHEIEFSRAEVGELERAERIFRFFVRLTYSDFMDDLHEAGFCWEWWRQPNGGFAVRPSYVPEAYTKRT